MMQETMGMSKIDPELVYVGRDDWPWEGFACIALLWPIAWIAVTWPLFPTTAMGWLLYVTIGLMVLSLLLAAMSLEIFVGHRASRPILWRLMGIATIVTVAVALFMAVYSTKAYWLPHFA